MPTVDTSSPWLLDPTITFLNHGSFGACPREVIEAQQRWRDRLEADPVQFLDRELERHLEAARVAVGAFIGADADDLAFVPNATSGVATVLRSLRFDPGDELLTTNHEYNATLNMLRFAAERDGARVVVADVRYPIHDRGEVLDAVLGCVTAKTRLALISHVTSPTALVLPLEELVREVDERGVETLVDGAHAVGMIPLDLRSLGATYYTGNGHKWLCGPKGSAFLYVRRDRQAAIRPLTISHGANSPRSDRSRFRLEFDWTGTSDPSAFLTLNDAIRVIGELRPGGWPEVMASNAALARAARDLLCTALEIEPPAPDDMLGSMASVPLPPILPGPPGSAMGAVQDDGPDDGAKHDPLRDVLFQRLRIEVPVGPWPVAAALELGGRPRARLLRVSAQQYNRIEQYEELVRALGELIPLRSAGL